MTDEPDNLVLDILKHVQESLARLEEGQAEANGEIATVKDHMGAMNMRLAAVESHMSGFMATSRSLDLELDFLRERIEALEEATPPSQE